MTATAPSRPTKRIGFGSTLSSWDLKLSPYLYISPFFILFFIVGLFPLGYTAVISFMDWDLVRNSGQFVGFDQYATVLGDPKFWIALRNTFSIFLLSSVPQLILAVFIAAMLDQNIRAKTFWRMGVLLPYVMAPVAVALIFSNMRCADRMPSTAAETTSLHSVNARWRICSSSASRCHGRHHERSGSRPMATTSATLARTEFANVCRCGT